MSDSAYDMLCKALELAEHAVQFYDEVVQGCGQSIGREVFEELKSDKQAHMVRIKEIHASLVSGATFSNACTLPDDETRNTREFFAALAAKYEGATCPADEMSAIERAMDLESKLMGFYENRNGEATDDVERQFTQRMVEETRGHHLLLTDMHAYYEDPEGWAREGTLDGA